MDFLDKLLEQFPDREIFLILDNASFHKTGRSRATARGPSPHGAVSPAGLRARAQPR